MAVENERTVTAMAEYIARESAIEAIMSDPPDAHYQSWYAEKINEIPAADVEPLVRCMDCKYHYWEQEPCHGKTVHYCKLPHMSGVEVFKEFFCYYGERKEGAD